MDKNLISKLFLERSKFILLGLTGRTGSGCTTTANILEEAAPYFPKANEVRYNSASFYSELDETRYSILREYMSENWTHFYSIKVSDLISAYLLKHDVKVVIETIFKCKTSQTITEDNIANLLKSGSFSKYKERTGIQKFQEMIFNHSVPVSLNGHEKTEFIRYLRSIRKFTRDFKDELRKLDHGLYVSTYQAAGMSIRKTGYISANYENDPFDPEKVFYLPECINRIIKALRKANERAFIAIDAIRNQHEARYFRDRYSAFYLISINAPDNDRTTYLQRVHKFNVDQLKVIDEKESGKGGDEVSYFIGPNVKKCIEISDIHIFNPRGELTNTNVLRAQLAWYIGLMLHPGLVSPTHMERIMQIAYVAKSNSGCISRQVGAVITDGNNSIKSVGWNDVPHGQIPCSLRSVDGALCSFDERIYSHYERHAGDFIDELKKYKSRIIGDNSVKDALDGRNLSYCFKDIKNNIDSKGNQVHTRSLHAEENAMLQLVKYGGIGIQGGKLYTTASPCELCSKKAYQLGIKEIVFIDPYPGIAKEHILNVGSNVPGLVQFRGAVGKGYHQLYEVFIPYKDELMLISDGAK